MCEYCTILEPPACDDEPDEPEIDFIVSPNPTNDELVIDFKLSQNARASATDRLVDVSILLYDNLGVVQRQNRFAHRCSDGNPGSVKFNVSNLREGTYYLHIESNGEIRKEQIIIKRN